LDGTFPPARRASDSPIAIACFRLLTFFPDLPDFNSPRFISCIARLTFCEAFFPYFLPLDFVGMDITSMDFRQRAKLSDVAVAIYAATCVPSEESMAAWKPARQNENSARFSEIFGVERPRKDFPDSCGGIDHAHGSSQES
jgi:hypothetical protein